MFASACLSLTAIIRLWEIVHIRNHLVSILLWQYALQMNKLSLIPRFLAKYKFCLVQKLVSEQSRLWKIIDQEVFRDWCSLKTPLVCRWVRKLASAVPRISVLLPLTLEEPWSKLSITGTSPSQLICWLPVAIQKMLGKWRQHYESMKIHEYSMSLTKPLLPQLQASWKELRGISESCPVCQKESSISIPFLSLRSCFWVDSLENEFQRWRVGWGGVYLRTWSNKV